jgi:hypothetical protein
MAYLTLLSGKLRIDWAASTLILSDSEEDPCCCCPPIVNFCVNFSHTEYTLFFEGKYHVLFQNSGVLQIPGDEPPTTRYLDGFPKCIAENYKVTGFVKRGSYFDDYGSVEGVDCDNHEDCRFNENGLIPGFGKTTTLTEDTTSFELSFVAFPSNPDYFYIPISFQANSSNCGPPTGIGATVCLTFEPKEE